MLINTYLLHRDPRHFPEPSSYKPERFMAGEKFPLFAYIPFSAGSRNCIGWKFATMTVKMIILSILLNYEVHSVHTEEQLRFKSEVVLNNEGGIRLRVTPRV